MPEAARKAVKYAPVWLSLDAIVLAESHELIGAEALKAFIPSLNPEPPLRKPRLSVAEIASDMPGEIVGVCCAP